MRPFTLPAVLLAITAHAQQPGCGFDALNERLTSPARTATIDHLDRQVLSIPSDRSRGTGHTIPVVFHVVHDNGPENVPDSILQLAVDQVNLRYQNTEPYADPTGHVVPVTLCLAGTDPFGGPTTGVTRHSSAHTTTSMAAWEPLKGIARWDPYRYLNVWVVRSITDQNVDGYSSFPADAGTAWDGVVIEAQYLVNNYLLTHELGHYLGLYHTFQGYCWNYNCELDGDHVCDTPPDDSNWFTCMELRCNSETQDTSGLSPFTGDVPELPNYMDYSGCTSRSFSQGQVDRMSAFLATARTGLDSSYGCGTHPYGPPPVASVQIDSSGCTGQITFINTTPDAAFVQWDLGNDGWDAVGPVWAATFDSTGTYAVLVAVGTAQGTDTLVLTFHVRVPPTAQYPIVGGYDGLVVDPWNNLPTACLGDTLPLSGAPGMLSYLWSTGDTTPAITWPVTGPFHLSLTTVDSTGAAWTSCAFDSVNVHPPSQITSAVGDTIHCGDLLTISMPVPDFPVSYTWFRDGGVLIGSTTLLISPSWSIGTVQYVVRLTDNAGCELWTNALDITTLPTVPPVITQVGADLMLDHTVMNMNWYTADGAAVFNMNVPAVYANAPPGCYYVAGYDCAPVMSDTLCVLPLGLPSAPSTGAVLFPQPAQDRLWLRPAPTNGTTSWLTDATGRILRRIPASAWAGGLAIDDLSPGTYQLVLPMDAPPRTHRFVKVP